MPSALRILVPLWCPLPPTFRLLDAPLTTPGYRSQTPRPCPASCSCPHPSPAWRGTGRLRVGEVTGPRAKAGPRASAGSGVVSRRQFPPSFPSLAIQEIRTAPPTEMTVADFPCWAFPVSPWGVPLASRLPSASMEWMGRLWGSASLVCVCGCIDLCFPGQQVPRPAPPASPNSRSPVSTNKDMGVGGDLRIPQSSEGPHCHRSPLNPSSAGGSSIFRSWF